MHWQTGLKHFRWFNISLRNVTFKHFHENEWYLWYRLTKSKVSLSKTTLKIKSWFWWFKEKVWSISPSTFPVKHRNPPPPTKLGMKQSLNNQAWDLWQNLTIVRNEVLFIRPGGVSQGPLKTGLSPSHRNVMNICEETPPGPWMTRELQKVPSHHQDLPALFIRNISYFKTCSGCWAVPFFGAFRFCDLLKQ